VVKFPYKKNRNSDEKEDSSLKNYKKGKTKKRRKFLKQNNNLYQWGQQLVWWQWQW